MQLVNQPSTRNEALLGGKQVTGARPPAEATQASQAPQSSESEKTGGARPAVPQRTPSIRWEITIHESSVHDPHTCRSRQASNKRTLTTTNHHSEQLGLDKLLGGEGQATQI